MYYYKMPSRPSFLICESCTYTICHTGDKISSSLHHNKRGQDKRRLFFFPYWVLDSLSLAFREKLPYQKKRNLSQSRSQSSGEHLGVCLPLRPPERTSNEWPLTGLGDACENREAWGAPRLPGYTGQTKRSAHTHTHTHLLYSPITP